MKIKNSRDIFLFAITATLVAGTVVAITVLLAYPREQWNWELKISLSLTIAITMSICIFVGRKSLETYQLTLELKRLVERDRLTDVSTRDYFYNRMAEDPEAFGVSLMVDIDKFKSINDTYGHMAGDEVIRTVASILREGVRGADLICRFGGEEFVVFLRDHQPDEAYVVAERIRKTIESKSIVFDDNPLSVTVSIGGSLSARVSEIDDAIKQADAALYRAKEAGRNQTIFEIFDQPPSFQSKFER